MYCLVAHLNAIPVVVCFSIVGALSFLFFSGELKTAIPVDTISDYIVEYTPQLNFYLVPVIVSLHSGLLKIP